MFLNPTRFDFLAPLESAWQTVRAELEALEASRFVPWPERALYDAGWDVYGLYAFGRRLEQNCVHCPQTCRLVTAIPGMSTAGFSSLAPGAHIKPHRGYTKAVLRCHLGLIAPPECTLRVGDQTRSWQEGRIIVFDDTEEHEAWNRSGSRRIVLLVDFARPGSDGIVAIPASVRDSVDMLTGADDTTTG